MPSSASVSNDRPAPAFVSIGIGTGTNKGQALANIVNHDLQIVGGKVLDSIAAITNHLHGKSTVEVPLIVRVVRLYTRDGAGREEWACTADNICVV